MKQILEYYLFDNSDNMLENLNKGMKTCIVVDYGIAFDAEKEWTQFDLKFRPPLSFQNDPHGKLRLKMQYSRNVEIPTTTV